MPTPIDAYRTALARYHRNNSALPMGPPSAPAVPGIDMPNVGAAITAPDALLPAQSNEDEIRNNILAAGWTPMEKALLTPAVPPEYEAVG